jgi:PIN domain nuclease of toxin-antitoxin system
VQYLIDTHTFLWFVENSPSLSKVSRNLIENKQNQILISIASVWEISIKTSIGKLQIKGTYTSVIDDLNDNDIEILPIMFAHTVENNQLPFHHRDPFDRIIAAQAIVENIDFISADAAFDSYFSGKSVKRIW